MGTAPYTYSWNTTPVQNTSSITNLTAGTYVVTVRDANNCNASNSVEISKYSRIYYSMSTTAQLVRRRMSTASVQITGGSGNFSYVWVPSVSTGANATD
ncbi:MAG: hypothetical protein IPL24_12935 [Bacteroidetes bacterium]|nr:hypothetical protein [Bacteroidota bacterium]